ncbi:hypothetical protein BST11_21010 [Mycobacterium alsense]|uniref:Uncharacterized protein n=1 Tax=Mycobacterium alsense TaxID=324058 RepID=A0AA41XMF1_9MYCO|nr:hypothetical protein [Mycobacterium alsense]MCV7377940.1 hypothetical protein [Mycobacterium alsense]OQZ88805.1 hypothetical protein BST11_21010 [Mycobacterium alsense]
MTTPTMPTTREPAPPGVLPAIPFMAPLVNPAPIGLYPLVNWTDVPADQPSRFLGEGVWVRHYNYGGAGAFGVWDAPWCGEVERITISGTGGTWTYTWSGETATGLASNISVADFQAAIDGLSNVEPGGAHVSSPCPGVYLVSHTVRAESSVDGSALTGPSAGAKTQPVRKEGDRPPDTDPFPPITVWASGTCDMTIYGQQEAMTRAEQNLRLLEQVAVERDFSIRLLADSAAVTVERATLPSAISYLEGLLAETNTLGIVHASPQWAAIGAAQGGQGGLWVRSGTAIKTQLGHSLAFGGGYVDGLGLTLVATSAPIFGWRDEPALRTTAHYQTNEFIAIAERSVALAYEEIIGAVTVTTAP